MVYTRDTVQVPGLRAFAAELRGIDPDFQAQLKAANLAAAQIVAKAAIAKAGSVSRQAAFAARSLRAVGYQREGSIRIGGKTPQGRAALGAEFGSLRYGQFMPWLGNGTDAGYFLWPSIRISADLVTKEYSDQFDRIARRAFPEGRSQGTT